MTHTGLHEKLLDKTEVLIDKISGENPDDLQNNRPDQRQFEMWHFSATKLSVCDRACSTSSR